MKGISEVRLDINTLYVKNETVNKVPQLFVVDL
jgi:hypothetical protein